MQPTTDLRLTKNLKYDLPAGVVVFLVALPLCLGIALASGAPLFSGILAGIIGGLIVPLVSRSALSVSGPAAGLTAIILAGIASLGDISALLGAIMIGGLVQIILGLVRAGSIAYFFPSSVIKGMLAAIGIILITKQLPLAVGYDSDKLNIDALLEGGISHFYPVLAGMFSHIESGAVVISVISLALMIVWEKTPLRKIAFLPAALIVVVFSTLLNIAFRQYVPALALSQEHLVHLPAIEGLKGLAGLFTFPTLNIFATQKVWMVGLTIGLVASVETLLSLEAVDQLDPYKRQSPLNRELLAQGIANFTCGLLGALPVTAVIVRSSTNVSVGARTKMSAIFHGIFLLSAVVFAGNILNKIPLASLAAILLMVGYKLAKPALFKSMYKLGWNQLLPFIVTIVAILLTDLLIGIAIGLAVGIFFVIRTNFHSAVTVRKEDEKYVVHLRKDVSFLNKATMVQILERIPDNTTVVIDGSRVEFIDHDMQEIIDNFKFKAVHRGVQIETRDTKYKHQTKKKNKQYAEVHSESH